MCLGMIGIAKRNDAVAGLINKNVPGDPLPRMNDKEEVANDDAQGMGSSLKARRKLARSISRGSIAGLSASFLK